MPGNAIQIITLSDDHSFVLNENALKDVLMRDEIKNRYVVVVWVTGTFRKGKSFLLNFFLRYLYAKYEHYNAADWLGASNKLLSSNSWYGGIGRDQYTNFEEQKAGDWLGVDDEPLLGFPWRGVSRRDTTGIVMWSDVFLHDYLNGEKVAIILLDTQSAFDCQMTLRDYATVFALSAMLSSVQIHNLSYNIREEDLQHLQLYTEYGRLALADSGKKPFQRLQFIVRDWTSPLEMEYGVVGGEKLFKRQLEIYDKNLPNLQSLHRHIYSCFEEVSCFLMPYPGVDVATNPNFDGRLNDITSVFKQSLRELVPMLLSPTNLVLKEINGKNVRARDLIQYFKSYLTTYKSIELPKPKSILMATVEVNHQTAIITAKKLYNQLMQDVCGSNRPYLSTISLEAQHLLIKKKILHHFASIREIAGEGYSELFCSQLDNDLNEIYLTYKAYNKGKDIFKSARTVSVYFVCAVIMYFLSGIFVQSEMYVLVNFCLLIMGLALIGLILWFFIRCSGELTHIGVYLELFATLLWENLTQFF